MNDEQYRQIFARVLSNEALLEMLVFAWVADKDPQGRAAFFKFVRTTARSIGPRRDLNDFDAEFIADVHVQAGDMLEAQIDRLDERLREALRGGDEPHVARD